MAGEAATLSALQTQIAQLRTELRRSELRLAGAREQLDRRVRAAQELPRSELDELRTRAERAEAQLAALLATRTMRTLRVPRGLYARALARRRR